MDSRSLVPGVILLLLACGSTRQTAVPHADTLTRFVLVIEQTPNGQNRHAWHPAAEFDPSSFANHVGGQDRAGRIVLASRRARDCDQEQIDCVRACMKRRLPSTLNHIKRTDGSKTELCQKECLDEYMDCLELQKAQALQFSTVDSAIQWLKENREGPLVGAIVVIAGVAFVTVSAGAGAVILAPVVLMAN